MKAARSMRRMTALLSCLALLLMSGVGQAASQNTSGVITSGSSSYKIFNTQRTVTANGNTFIKQTDSIPNESDMRYHLYRCDSTTAITNPYLGPIDDGEQSRNVSLLIGTCFRIGARRDIPQDTNGIGFGSGNTTFYITITWP